MNNSLFLCFVIALRVTTHILNIPHSVFRYCYIILYILNKSCNRLLAFVLWSSMLFLAYILFLHVFWTIQYIVFNFCFKQFYSKEAKMRKYVYPSDFTLKNHLVTNIWISYTFTRRQILLNIIIQLLAYSLKFCYGELLKLGSWLHGLWVTRNLNFFI